MGKCAETRMNIGVFRLFRIGGATGMIEQSARLQSTTLQRALDVLDSICRKQSERQTAIPERTADLRMPVRTGPSVTQGVAGELPPADPEEWRKPFVQWLDSACVRSPRWFTNVAHLHNAFCDWEIAQGEVPCRPETFDHLLKESDFLIGEVEEVVLVSGLALREDFSTAGL
jgi:hypothetical protein